MKKLGSPSVLLMRTNSRPPKLMPCDQLALCCGFAVGAVDQEVARMMEDEIKNHS